MDRTLGSALVHPCCVKEKQPEARRYTDTWAGEVVRLYGQD